VSTKTTKKSTAKKSPAKKAAKQVMAKPAKTKTAKSAPAKAAEKTQTKAAKKNPAKATAKTTAKATKKTAIKPATKTNDKPAKKETTQVPEKKSLKNLKKKTIKDSVKQVASKHKAAGKQVESTSAEQIEVEEKTKAIVLNARKRTSTPALFKSGKNKNTPVVFTMDDVKSIIEQRERSKAEEEAEARKKAANAKKAEQAATPKKKVVDHDLPVENRNHAAASIADILGFNPTEKFDPLNRDEKVPKKFMKYYKALLELRQHVSSELDLHTADTLKRSNKDDSGDLSGYGQHMADAGTDTFNRDFALSLVSTEQEALYEIEEAIQRIFDGTYGICEITNEPINKDRLEAVPFTRYSLEGQKELERNNRSKYKRSTGGGVFGDANDESVNFGGEIEDN